MKMILCTSEDCPERKYCKRSPTPEEIRLIDDDQGFKDYAYYCTQESGFCDFIKRIIHK